MKKYFVLLFISLFFLFPKKASATNYYVSNSGSDSNAGTLTAPFKTIQKGIDRAGSGDTVYVRGGVYREYLADKPEMPQIRINKSNIRLLGYNNERPVIDGSKKLASNWTVYSGNNKIYQATVPNESISGHYRAGKPLRVGQITVDGVLLSKVSSISSMASETFYQPGALYRSGSSIVDTIGSSVYIWMPQGDSPASHTVGVIKSFDSWDDLYEYSLLHISLDREFAYRDSKETNLSNIEVSGFIIQNASGYGLKADKINGFKFTNNILRYSCGNNMIRWNENATVDGIEMYQNILQNYPHQSKVDIRTGEGLAWGGTFGFGGTNNSKIINSKIHDNHGEGITSGGDGITLAGSNNILIQNNIVYNNYSVGIYIHGSSNNTVDRNLVYNTEDFYDPNDSAGNSGYKTLTGIATAQEQGWDSATPLIMKDNVYTNNIVINSGEAFQFFCHKAGSGLNNNLIANNTFINSRGAAVRLGNTKLGDGKWRCTLSGNKFINNVFYKEGWWSMIDISGDDSLQFKNNVFFNNYYNSDYQFFSSNGVGYSFSGWQEKLGGSAEGNVWQKPDFENLKMVTKSNNCQEKSLSETVTASECMVFLGTKPEDYKLQLGSAGIDQGRMVENVDSLGYDFALVSRPQGEAIDIGAFEYTGVSGEDVTGDVNGDGVVDMVDVKIVLKNYGVSPPTDTRTDLNDDNKVNLLDFGLVIKNWGQ